VADQAHPGISLFVRNDHAGLDDQWPESELRRVLRDCVRAGAAWRPAARFLFEPGAAIVPIQHRADGSVPFVGSNFANRSASWIDPKMRMPYIMNWSGGFQWNFSQNWLLETTYQGSRGVRLLNGWDINQIPLNISADPAQLLAISNAPQLYKPYPQFGTIRHYSNYGDNSYHGVTFRTEKRTRQA
jgi:hypothetical protein